MIFYGLVEGAELVGEGLDRLERGGARRRRVDLGDGFLGVGVEALGQGVEAVGGDVHPAALLAGIGKTSRRAAQNPSAPSPTASTGAESPRSFSPRSTSAQESVDSR